MDGFLTELLGRLPLAEATLLVLRHCWDDAFLADLFERYGGRCYTDKIDLPTLVQLVRDALLRYGGSAHKAFRQAITEARLDAAISATYQKLGRIPLTLSIAFLRQCTARLAQLLPSDPLPARQLPRCLRGLKVWALDGKTIKHVTRKLKPLRALRGKMLGGKLLVVLDLQHDLALAMNADPDAFRNDAVLVDGLLEQLPPEPQHPALFIADRQFCDLRLMHVIADVRCEHFLIRYNRSVDFLPDPHAPQRQGIDQRHRRWTDQQGWLGAASNKHRRRVRLIRLHLTGPGQQDVILVTDLTDPQAFPAEQLLDAYLVRWGIEQAFQKVTEVFNLKHLIGSTPNATIFQAAFCLLLYNLTQLIKAYVAGDTAKDPQQISTGKLFDDACDQLTAWMLLACSAGSLRMINHLYRQHRLDSVAALRRRLGRVLHGTWTDWWTKSPTRSHPPNPSPPPRYAKSGRASVHRVLQQYRATQQSHHKTT